MARNLVRFDPFRELDSFAKDFFGEGFTRSIRTKAPAVDIYTDDDKALIVEAHLPGFAPEDVSVDVHKGALVLQAQKHEKEEQKDKKRYVVRESSDSFYRSIALPEQADEASISASFSDGVLKVSVPLAEEAAPTKIPITSSGA